VEKVYVDYNAQLSIKNAVNSGKEQWKFIYKEKTIKASIADEKWLEDYQLGRNYFPANALLIVDLAISETVISKDVKPTYKYSVTKVHSELYNKGQESLFAEDTSNNLVQ